MTLPSFSIVVPTYQRRDLVCDVARAIGRIDYGGAVELFVVADGCNDGTAQALRAIALPFPFTVIEQDNAGPGHARNTGARAASGEILLFLDDDMIVDRGILLSHAESYAQGADSVLGHIPLDPASPPGPLSAGVGRWAEERCAALSSGTPLDRIDFLTGQMSVRRALFEELGGFDGAFTSHDIFGNEDADFGKRIMAGHRVVFNPQAISFQRYVVTPRENVERWYRAGRADVLYARKHFDQAAQIFQGNGGGRLLTRLFSRPLALWDGGARRFQEAVIALYEAQAGKTRWSDRALGALINKAREVSYWRGVRSNGGEIKARRALVLCYHAMTALPGDPVIHEYGIDRAAFIAQLDDLTRRGYAFISAQELLEALEGRSFLPERSVLLTFDDCYHDLLDTARAVLEPRGIPALAFAVTALPSNTNEWDQPLGATRLDLLDAAGLRALSQHGVEIGGHSRRHRELPLLSAGERHEEIAGCAEDLAAMGLPRPRFFAYPYGANDSQCRTLTRKAGFTAAFLVEPGHAEPGCDRFGLPRVEIHSHSIGWKFWLKTAFPRLDHRLRMAKGALWT